MGIEDAIYATQLLNPKQLVPIRYNTFGMIRVYVQEFKDGEDDREVLMKPGARMNLD